jgi:glycosyltransferase involved in cell wall biosynthesis
VKIAMLTTSYPKWAGETTAPFIEEIAVAVAARGHEVHVVMPHRADLRRGAVERGVHLHTYAYAPHPDLEVWGYAAAMHGDVGIRNAALRAAPYALRAGFRAVMRLTAGGDFDMMHGHWALPNGPVAALCARVRGLPLVISLHGSDVFLAERAAPVAWAARWAATEAGAITACSGDLAARLAALGGPSDRMVLVPYGVDAEAFKPGVLGADALRAQLGLAPDQPVLFSIGRMVYKKGFNILLDAMPRVLARHPKAVLVLAGYGDLFQDLKAQATRLGITGSVIMPGAVPHDEVPVYFEMADAAVFPSVHDQRGNVDGLPNVLLEAMALGKPIVASRIAGIPQVIADGDNGLLVPEGDGPALAAAINRLLDYPQQATQFGKAARARVERELRWSHVAARFEAVYEQAAQRHASR